MSHSPGNGTRYEAVAVRLPQEFDPDLKIPVWVISFPLWGLTYYFNEGSYVSFDYLKEKFKYDRMGIELCDTDIHEMSKMVAYLINGSHNAATDAHGNLRQALTVQLAQQL